MQAEELCPSSHYRCGSEWLYCLPVYTRCNGLSDCVHGDDERDCQTAMCTNLYRCRSSTVCVHADHLCDGWGQCPLRDDEFLCDFFCPQGCQCLGQSFSCRNSFLPTLAKHLRFMDASGSDTTLADYHEHVYLIYLKLSNCFVFNVSQTNLILSLIHI